jgi:hypothetical protein
MFLNTAQLELLRTVRLACRFTGYMVLRARAKITSLFLGPMHPAWQGASTLKNANLFLREP